jgi:hypothetical protein
MVNPAGCVGFSCHEPTDSGVQEIRSAAFGLPQLPRSPEICWSEKPEPQFAKTGDI